MKWSPSLMGTRSSRPMLPPDGFPCSSRVRSSVSGAPARSRIARPVAVEESGLEKRPRRVPDEHAATPDEIRTALDALGEADFVRLEKAARYRVRGLGRRASGRNHEDLLNEAIADTLDPEKRRWNRQVSFVTHLLGALRSIASHWKEQFDADEPRLESEIVRTSEEGEPLSPLDLVGSDASDAERAVEARQELEQIQKMFAGDRIV